SSPTPTGRVEPPPAVQTRPYPKIRSRILQSSLSRAHLPLPPPTALPARRRGEPRNRHGGATHGPGAAGGDRSPHAEESGRAGGAAADALRPRVPEPGGARRRLRQGRRRRARPYRPRLRLRRGGDGHSPPPAWQPAAAALPPPRQAEPAELSRLQQYRHGGDAAPPCGAPLPTSRRQSRQEQGDAARAGARRLRDADPGASRALRLSGGEPLLSQHPRATGPPERDVPPFP